MGSMIMIVRLLCLAGLASLAFSFAQMRLGGGGRGNGEGMIGKTGHTLCSVGCRMLAMPHSLFLVPSFQSFTEEGL